jgi:hypothetical protein
MRKIFVEHENDKYFFERLINHFQKDNDTAQNINIASFEPLDGLSFEKLKTELEKLKTQRIHSDQTEIFIGILIDADNPNKGDGIDRGGVQNRLIMINQAIEDVFGEKPNFTKMCTNTSDFFSFGIENEVFEQITIKIGCHFVNIDGEGEMETLLKAIKTRDSFAADCLEAWKKCYLEKLKTAPDFEKFKMNLEIKEGERDKEFDKIWKQFYETYDIFIEQEFLHWWTDFYHRNDTLTKKEKTKGKENASYEMIFTGRYNNEKQRTERNLKGAEIYDFESKLPEFQDLSNFLRAFL